MEELDLDGTKKPNPKKKRDSGSYIKKVLVSSHIFAGNETIITMFDRSEDAKDRNYKSESNPFDSAQGGKAIVMKADLLGPKYGSIQIGHSNANVLNAIAKVRNAGIITLKLGKDVIHEDVMSNLLPPVPILFKAEYTDNTAIPPIVTLPEKTLIPPPYAVLPQGQSTWIKKSLQVIIPFEPSIFVKSAEQFAVEISFLGGVATSDFAAIVGYILKLELNSMILTVDKKLAA